MARIFYGCSGADVIARQKNPGVDDDLELGVATYDAYTDRIGGSPVIDLLDAAGSAITQVVANQYGIRVQGPDGFTDELWLQNAAVGGEPRWLLNPVDLARRTAVDVSDFYEFPAGGIPQADLDAATEAKLDGAIQKSTVDAAGDLIVGTADNTVARLPLGTALQVPRVKADLSGLEYASLPAAPDLSPYATKAGSIKQFADVTDANPPGGMDVPALVWDYGTSSLVWVDLAVVFASLDNGRIRNSQRPKYNPDIIVKVEGDPTPPDAGAGGVGAVVWDEAAAPSLVPLSHGANGGANVVAATGVTKATVADINVGDWVCIPVGTSGEATLPSTYTVTLAAGAVSGGFAAQTPAGQQSGSCQQDWVIGRCTTLIPAGTNITVKANQNRVEMIQGIISVPNLLNPAIDKAFEGNGGSGTDLTLDSNSSGTLAQPDEVILYALTFNSGLPVIRSQDARAGSGLIPLFNQFDASAAGSSRSMRAYYKVVAATTAQTGQVDVTSSDGNSGAWAGKGITLKAA